MFCGNERGIIASGQHPAGGEGGVYVVRRESDEGVGRTHTHTHRAEGVFGKGEIVSHECINANLLMNRKSSNMKIDGI